MFNWLRNKFKRKDQEIKYTSAGAGPPAVINNAYSATDYNPVLTTNAISNKEDQRKMRDIITEQASFNSIFTTIQDTSPKSESCHSHSHSSHHGSSNACHSNSSCSSGSSCGSASSCGSCS